MQSKANQHNTNEQPMKQDYVFDRNTLDQESTEATTNSFPENHRSMKNHAVAAGVISASASASHKLPGRTKHSHALGTTVPITDQLTADALHDELARTRPIRTEGDVKEEEKREESPMTLNAVTDAQPDDDMEEEHEEDEEEEEAKEEIKNRLRDRYIPRRVMNPNDVPPNVGPPKA